MTDDESSRAAEPAPAMTAVSVYRLVRRLVIALLGLSVLALGLALLVLPGPAFIVLPAGLAILALEFEWARRWLRTLQTRLRNATQGADRGRSPEQR